MNSRPNLPVVLVLIAIICCEQSGWAGAEAPAGGAAKTASTAAPSPTQKPVTVAPGSAAPAGPPAAIKSTTASPPAPRAATGPAPTPVTPLPTDPAEVLRMTRERLTRNRESIRARIVERVSISGRKFRLEGSYLQGTDLRLRLELKVISDNTERRVEGSLLEVCNGTILWAIYKVGKESRITRRDVSQILSASKTNGRINFSTVELGLGGLPALLASLEHWMKFELVTQEQIRDKKFSVLVGAWKDTRRKELLSKMSKQHLPEHVPDSVRIYLESDSLFPRRIAFLKHRGSQVEPLAELDLVGITLDSPVNERQFEYVPPDGARPVDVTAEYVQQLQNAGP